MQSFNTRLVWSNDFFRNSHSTHISQFSEYYKVQNTLCIGSNVLSPLVNRMPTRVQEEIAIILMSNAQNTILLVSVNTAQPKLCCRMNAIMVNAGTSERSMGLCVHNGVEFINQDYTSCTQGRIRARFSTGSSCHMTALNDHNGMMASPSTNEYHTTHA